MFDKKTWKTFHVTTFYLDDYTSVLQPFNGYRCTFRIKRTNRWRRKWNVGALWNNDTVRCLWYTNHSVEFATLQSWCTVGPLKESEFWTRVMGGWTTQKFETVWAIPQPQWNNESSPKQIYSRTTLYFLKYCQAVNVQFICGASISYFIHPRYVAPRTFLRWVVGGSSSSIIDLASRMTTGCSRSNQRRSMMVIPAFYETTRIMVFRMRSNISSRAASGKRLRDGIKAKASSTMVSVPTRFIKAATSHPCNSNSFCCCWWCEPSGWSSSSKRNDWRALNVATDGERWEVNVTNRRKKTTSQYLLL